MKLKSRAERFKTNILRTDFWLLPLFAFCAKRRNWSQIRSQYFFSTCHRSFSSSFVLLSAHFHFLPASHFLSLQSLWLWLPLRGGDPYLMTQRSFYGNGPVQEKWRPKKLIFAACFGKDKGLMLATTGLLPRPFYTWQCNRLMLLTRLKWWFLLKIGSCVIVLATLAFCAITKHLWTSFVPLETVTCVRTRLPVQC